MTEKTNSSAPERPAGGSMILDMLAAVPGWLAALAIDPFAATAAGVPIAACLVAARRLLWSRAPWRGRLAVLVLQPALLVAVVPAGVFGINGPLLGCLLAAALVAVAEGLNRRHGLSLVVRYPLAVTVAFLGLGVALSALVLGQRLSGYPTEDFLKDLAAPPDVDPWSAAARKQAMRAVREVVERDATSDDAVEALYERLAPDSADLIDAASDYGVFVVLYEKSGYKARGMARGGKDALADVIDAAAFAASQAPRKPRTGEARPRLWRQNARDVRVQIEVVGQSRHVWFRPVFHLARFFRLDKAVRSLPHLPDLVNLSYAVEPGVDGWVIRSPGRAVPALMLPDDPITEGWLTPRVESNPAAIREMLRRTWEKAYGETAGPVATSDLSVRTFRTYSFLQIAPDAPVVELYRANRLLPDVPSRDELVQAIVSTSDWLARQVRPDGKFHYEIFPPYQAETWDYNLPRHAGSIYGLFAMARAAKTEPAFSETAARGVEAGLKALDYVKSNLGSPDEQNAPELLCFLGRDRLAESGSTALAALSLVQLPDPRDVRDPETRRRVEAVPVDEWLSGMGRCLIAMIDDRGRVFRSYGEALRLGRVKKEPLYFPGEVMLALAEAHERTKDPAMLEAARRIADAQVKDFYWDLKLGLPRTPDHWVMQGLAVLARITGHAKYAETSVLMGHAFTREQFPPQLSTFPDYRGSYRRVADVPRTTRAASRGEALGGSRDAALLIGEDTAEFDAALLEGARHLMEQTFDETNSFFVPAGYDVRGAIRMGIVDNHCRIDNNQHALVGLLRALEAMDGRGAARSGR